VGAGEGAAFLHPEKAAARSPGVLNGGHRRFGRQDIVVIPLTAVVFQTLGMRGEMAQQSFARVLTKASVIA